MAFISLFSVLIITLILLVWVWLKNKFNYWKSRGVETPPFTIPLGHMKDALLLRDSMADRMLTYYEKMKAQNIRHGGLYLMWEPMYIPIDNEIIKALMQSDFQHFVDRGIYVNEKSDPLSAHLFSLEGKKWKLLRNKLSPTFTSGKLKMMFQTLVDCTDRLHEVMDNEIGKPIDIKDILGRFTTDIIGSVAFGIDCNSLENPKNEFREKGCKIFTHNIRENLKQFFTFIAPNFMKFFNVNFTSDDVSEFFLGVVKQTVEHREKNNVTRKDFMQLLIELKNKGKLVDEEKLAQENMSEDDNRITMDEIAAQAFVFFVAGFETSSTTMTFCLYELAKHKDIQDKVREEMRRIMNKYEGTFTYDAAVELVYLEQVIEETLRKYPPLPSLNRVCTKEYRVPGTNLVLEKGVKVGIPVMGIHYDPEYYPDPQRFDPDRFTDEAKKSRPSFTYLPFGDGPRICIGLRFGMMQTKVGLVALLLNYEFSVSEKTKQPIQFDPESFITSTKGGMWLEIKKISKETKKLY